MGAIVKNAVQRVSWSDRLALDVALCLEGGGDGMGEILSEHGISREEMERYVGDRVFMRKVGLLREELREGGLSFRLKARAQAEELLKASWMLIHDESTSRAVRADLIKSTMKWAGYEVRGGDGVGGSGVVGPTITINMGGGGGVIEGKRVIEGSVSKMPEVKAERPPEEVYE